MNRLLAAIFTEAHEIWTFVGVVVAAIAGVIGGAILKRTRSTSITVSVSEILTQMTQLTAEIGEVKAENVLLSNRLKEFEEEQKRLIEKIKALEAEATRIELLRDENETLEAKVLKLRRRVKRLEDCLRDHGIDPPPDPEFDLENGVTV